MLLPSMSIIADVAYAAAESMLPVIVFQRHDYNKIVILNSFCEIGRILPPCTHKCVRARNDWFSLHSFIFIE